MQWYGRLTVWTSFIQALRTTLDRFLQMLKDVFVRKQANHRMFCALLFARLNPWWLKSMQCCVWPAVMMLLALQESDFRVYRTSIRLSYNLNLFRACLALFQISMFIDVCAANVYACAISLPCPTTCTLKLLLYFEDDPSLQLGLRGLPRDCQ